MSVPSPTPDTPDDESLLEKARNEARKKIAALHAEEGTVDSEGEQNSPSPEDVTSKRLTTCLEKLTRNHLWSLQCRYNKALMKSADAACLQEA